MNLGFIGTGEITKAVVEGITKSKIKYRKIYLSKRNNIISKYLKKLNKKVNIVSDNQTIIDKSNWIFLAVTPTVGKIILKNLKFNSNKTIISFISTIKMEQLKKMVKTKATIVRAIPLPPISMMKGPIPIYPKNKKVKLFFNKIGDCIETSNEKSSLNFWSISSLMAPYFQLLSETSRWLQKKGMSRTSSQLYITSLFYSLSKVAVSKSKKDLNLLVKNSQTPKGLNEQSLRFLKKEGYYKKLNTSLDKIYKRLK